MSPTGDGPRRRPRVPTRETGSPRGGPSWALGAPSEWTSLSCSSGVSSVGKAWLATALLVLVGCGWSLPASVPTTVTPLSQAELKYRLVDQVGMPLYCDPDRYPVARGDEKA